MTHTRSRTNRLLTYSILAGGCLAGPLANAQATEDWPPEPPAPEVEDKAEASIESGDALDASSTTTSSSLTASRSLPSASFEAAAAQPAPPPDIHVDIELWMLMDVSGSVDDQEFALQLDGYVQAFRDPGLQEAIAERSGVAVYFSQWSSTSQMSWSGWRVLNDEADCEAFADWLSTQTRQFRHNTIMAQAIEHARWGMENNEYISQKQIIDVSGDGICNSYLAYPDEDVWGTRYGTPWNWTMDQLPETMVLNGISIGDDSVRDWYAAHVPHGFGAFAMHANDFHEFADGITRKIQKEIRDPLDRICYD